MANKNYPHPVLSSYTDDFDPSKAKFDIKISKKIDRMNYQLLCDVVLEEENLKDLLNKGKLAFVVKVICSTTRYRNLFQCNDLEYLIIIPAFLLEKRVEITTFIVATEQINNYSSLLFNEDYGDASFTVFQGDVLAEGSEYKFNVDKQIDPLVKVPSIFSIVYSDSNQAPPIDVRHIEEKIVVTLNKENFQKYKYLKGLQNQFGNLAALTSSLFILPGLITVVDEMRRELMELNGDFEAIKDFIEEKENEHRWYKVINARLLDKGIKLSEPVNITESSLVIAQKLLGDPLSNGLQFFDEILEASEEDVI